MAVAREDVKRGPVPHGHTVSDEAKKHGFVSCRGCLSLSWVPLSRQWVKLLLQRSQRRGRRLWTWFVRGGLLCVFLFGSKSGSLRVV